MSGSVNKVILIGHLARDPETRMMSSGDKVVNMTVATSERWKDRQTGERKEKAEFHRVVVFDQNIADVVEKYLEKGSHIFLEGALQTRKWTDQSGVEKYSTEIVLQRFRGTLTMLGGPGEKAEEEPIGGIDRSPNPHWKNPGTDDLDDDIPFD